MGKLNEQQKTVIKTKKEYYSNKDVMQMENKNIKNNIYELRGKRQLFLYHFLSKNDISKNWNYTLDSLTNEYRKVLKKEKEEQAKKEGYKFRTSFKSNEFIGIQDVKQVILYFYHQNKRLFEYYRNDKNNYILHEVKYIENLSILRSVEK